MVEAETARRFHLPDVDRLNPRTNDFGNVRAAVQAHCHDARRKAIEIRNEAHLRKRYADHRKPVKDEHQLHHQRRSAEEFDVCCRQPFQGFDLAHARRRHQHTQNRSEQNREYGDDQRIADALQKEFVIADDQVLHRD